MRIACLVLLMSTVCAEAQPFGGAPRSPFGPPRSPFELPSEFKWKPIQPAQPSPSGPTQSVRDPIRVTWPPAEWFRWGSLYAAYVEAVRTQKRLVVLFEQNACTPCLRLRGAIIFEPDMKPLYDKAVFVSIDPARDEDDKSNVAYLKRELNIAGYPATAVLTVSKDVIVDVGRVVGYYPGPDYAAKLAEMLK